MANAHVAIYFITFIVFGTMIILNLFIGIIMNSMAEMHAEIEAQDRERHEKELGLATLADEFNKLEQQLDALKKQAATLKRRAGEAARSWQATDDARFVSSASYDNVRRDVQSNRHNRP